MSLQSTCSLCVVLRGRHERTKGGFGFWFDNRCQEFSGWLPFKLRKLGTGSASVRFHFGLRLKPQTDPTKSASVIFYPQTHPSVFCVSFLIIICPSLRRQLTSYSIVLNIRHVPIVVKFLSLSCPTLSRSPLAQSNSLILMWESGLVCAYEGVNGVNFGFVA